MKSLKKAFTLLEMLVVIGIIAVLVGLGTVSFTTAQKKARDAKRKGDLSSVQKAFEQYYSICGFDYPGSLGTSVTCANPNTEILNPVPTDPKDASSYVYTYDSAKRSFTLCATLETETPAQYCVSSQQ
ncbi:type II secretion system protein [Candidatus Roizmanbacteria bacterium]|nr:type II secretion system protein [Candidatus Roizmanbacteria bacterium]